MTIAFMTLLSIPRSVFISDMGCIQLLFVVIRKVVQMFFYCNKYRGFKKHLLSAKKSSRGRSTTAKHARGPGFKSGRELVFFF